VSRAETAAHWTWKRSSEPLEPWRIALFDLHKRDRAREGLLEIWLHTAEEWGAEQADRYLDLIQAAFDRLRENPFLGTDCSSIRLGYRRLTVERHRIFYIVARERIEIVRVQHERMNALKQLRK
jgi:toxin ParE1/3/4